MKTRVLSLHPPGERRSPLLVALAIAASLAVALLGLLAWMSLLAVTASAATVERYVVDGDRLEVSDLAGSVRVVAGSGPSAEVFLVRGGRDGGKLRVVRNVHDGVTHLHVVFPGRRIVYRNMRNHGTSHLSVGRDGCLGRRSGFMNQRVTVARSGFGLEAWADLEIRVPRGRAPAIRLGVGDISANGIEGTIVLDTGNGPVSVRDTRGSLVVDTGSGEVTLDGHEGELSVDTGSGGVEVARVHGPSIHVDTGSGHVTGAELAGDELLVDTGSGSVELERVRSQEILVDTGSGAVRITLDESPRSLKVDTGSGGVSILAPSDLGAVVDLESGSGGIDTDFAMGTLHHEHGELRGTIGDGRGHIVVDVGSGGVSLRRR